jgi:hypothetical protein
MGKMDQEWTPIQKKLAWLDWWIQGTISATLIVVGVDKITRKGPLQWGFNVWTFFFLLNVFFF